MQPGSQSLPETPQHGPFAMLERIADGLSLLAAYLAALCVVVLTGLILAEIGVALLTRVIPSLPSGIGIAWEYSAYLMGGAFMLGAGMTLRAGQQIRVELLLRAWGGRQLRLFDTLSSVAGSVLTVYLAWALISLTVRTYGHGEVSQDSFTQLWVPQAVLALGAVLLALQMIVRMIANVLGRPAERPDLGAATAIEG
jgi:TRAP-type mannitol/chloroaromatic compound transport system permease small subunit